MAWRERGRDRGPPLTARPPATAAAAAVVLRKSLRLMGIGPGDEFVETLSPKPRGCQSVPRVSTIIRGPSADGQDADAPSENRVIRHVPRLERPMHDAPNAANIRRRALREPFGL